MSRSLLLILALMVHACAHAPASRPSDLNTRSYTGDITIAAHLREPGQTLTLPARLDVWSDRERSCVALTLKASKTPSSVWCVLGDDVTLSKGETSTLLTGNEAARARVLTLGMRELMLGRKGRAQTLAHDTFGDVRQQVRRHDGLVHVEHAESDVRWTARLKESPSTRRAVARPNLAETLREVSGEAPMPVETLGQGVHSLTMEAFDTRTFIVEFDTFLVVLESSLSVKGGQRIIEVTSRRWPNKPIKYVSFSHHHPHYTGGLRAFLAAGATVLTTADNAAFVRDLAARPFTVEPDAWSRRRNAAPIETFKGSFLIEEGQQRLELYDIGERSNHTKEYTIFYLPRQRLLLEGDLGWYLKEDAIRVSSRFAGLLSFVKERKLDVEQVVQTWPLQPPARFDALERAAKP